MRSGLFATVLSATTVAVFWINRLGPRGIPHDLEINLLLFLIVGYFASWLVASLQTARQRMAQRQIELERRLRNDERLNPLRGCSGSNSPWKFSDVPEPDVLTRTERSGSGMAVDSAQIGTWDFNPVTGEQELVRAGQGYVWPSS